MSEPEMDKNGVILGIAIMGFVMVTGVVGIIATAVSERCNCEPTLAPPPPGVTAEEWSKSP